MKYSSLEKVLQLSLNTFFKKLGANDIFVKLFICKNEEVFASAQGFNIFNNVYGKVELSSGLVQKLEIEEIEFVLAHEASHIYFNHLPIKLATQNLKNLVWLLGLRSPLVSFALLASETLKFLKYKFNSLPAEVEISRKQELQADIWGIVLTGNKNAALNCLKKLVNNNLNRPSHIWEVLGVKLPIMTMRERINEIMKKLEILEKEGIRF